jgi:MFS family permease
MTYTQTFDEPSRGFAKYNVLVLTLTACITMSAAPIAIATGGLAGQTLLGADKALATLPVTGFNLGIGLGAIPSAMLMRKIGRKYGFMTGALVSALGGLISAFALIFGYFWLFALGVFIIGFSYAFVVQYRFAAADYGDETFKAKAISYVMLGGIGAAIIGPNVAVYSAEMLAPYSFAGSYLAVSVLSVIGFFMLAFLRRAPSAGTGEDQDEAKGRPLKVILSQPKFIISAICTISAGSLMSFVMTAAPLAMIACGHSLGDAALGIQWHVIAMYGPSFFTGSLIARFGKERMVGIGLAMLLVCALVALSGLELWKFWLALILLGVGWNFAFIGGTTLVTTTYRHEERQRVQGVFDFLVYGLGAFASLMSGVVLNLIGWNMVNLLVFPIVAMAFAALFWLARQNRASIPA